ncbi:hypothetical protein GA0061099_10394 [Bradyrhizobium yuanmingense]|uniref:Uncharacterized protein n=1 Tax=Bradyrhizobium yuanmingense TaxID=108015 RepID=A0A1C3XKA2_9BRAD|nr:hypothetical protein [Bradyrhizobium yuanmingense]TWI18993.1 hypothetical protein IQ15_07019 [Bradyrhizobium yuanmingense]SCB52722.1 hypothetical protein GA0061099_10394 [Bradyrhizobium yuanmingense]
MGGKSTSTTTQSSETNPWAPAQSTLTGILGQLNSYLPQTGLTSVQNDALNTIQKNNATASGYNPAIQSYTQDMLSGGGALNQQGAINNAYKQYYDQTNPLASNVNYDPYSTPGFKDAISTMVSDITNANNSRFAGAGRDFSGANAQALGRGIAQGVAPTIAAQYNQNVQNQQGAAGNLYNAGNTTAGLNTGLQSLYNSNRGAGVSSVGTGLDAMNEAAKSNLAAEAQRLNIPLSNLGLLAQIGVPIAGLGGTSSGTSKTENQASGWQQFQQAMSGLGSFSNGPGGQSSGSGVMGLLNFL